MTLALAFALGILLTLAAVICGVAFVWWMFSAAAAWIEPDEPRAPPPAPKPTLPLPRVTYEEDARDD